MEITAKRLKELERAEAKMQALESAGVDGWDFYDDALEGYHKENELEERLNTLIDDLACVFGESAYEPSERGAGIAFNENVGESVLKLLKESKVIFSDLGEE